MPDSVAYSHDYHKCADGGLQLNLPPDLVPSGQYSRLTNAISRIEGQLQTRDGLALVCVVGVSAIHTIFRLNQANPSVNGERLFGLSSELWSAPLPAGDVPVQLTNYIVAGASFPAFPVSFDGAPLSIMPYRFDADPQAWAIIANGAKMMKRKASYYEQLGLPAPTVMPDVTVGAAGNLLGDYNYRYTYVNTVTNTESNPSPVETTTTSETIRPNAFTNPTPVAGLGGEQPFNNPANAYDGSTATYADGSVDNGPTNNALSCAWFGWTAPTITYGTLTLAVDLEAFYTFNDGTGSAPIVQVDYSLDNGATWSNGFLQSGQFGRQTAFINLPPATDLTQVQVRVWSFGFRVTPVHRTLQTRVYDIYTIGIPPGIADTTFTNQQAIVCVTPPVDPQESAIRLYRRGGTLTDTWYFVGQYQVTSLSQGVCGAGKLEIQDNAADSEIEANPTLELDNDMPVSSVNVQNQPLKAIWGFDERVLGCGDPGRPEVVYFSKRSNADAWPPQNWIVVADPGTEMMNGIQWNLRCYAWSRERLYTLVPNVVQGATFTPQETACRRGLKGRWGFCAGEKGMYFVSKDGIYVTQGGAEESIIDDSVRPLFPTFDNPEGRDTDDYEAVDMTDEDGLRLSRHNSEIWFDYTGKTSGTRQTLIYDERRNRWRAYFSGGDVLTSLAQMHYSEPETTSNLLTGKTTGSVLRSINAVADESDVIEVQVRTGAFDQGKPLNLKEYGDVIFDIDPGGADVANPVTITPYLDANQLPQAAITVTGSGRQRVALSLEDKYGLNISFLIEWNTTSGHAPVLYQLDILYREEPAAVQHWEIPVNSLGLQGWFHVRDCYVTLRSASDVTMKYQMDNGSEQTFTLPSTAGEKKKVYVPFLANKVKLAGFTFDSDADFRIYQPECELRAKAWVTNLGYSVIPLFGAEA